MRYSNAELSWPAGNITATIGGIEITFAVPEFSASVRPKTEGRLDVYAVRSAPGEKWELWAKMSNSRYFESVEPGVESWNMCLLLQAHFTRAPYAVEIKNSSNTGVSTNEILYKHPDIHLNIDNLNPNADAYAELYKENK